MPVLEKLPSIVPANFSEKQFGVAENTGRWIVEFVAMTLLVAVSSGILRKANFGPSETELAGKRAFRPAARTRSRGRFAARNCPWNRFTELHDFPIPFLFIKSG